MNKNSRKEIQEVPSEESVFGNDQHFKVYFEEKWKELEAPLIALTKSKETSIQLFTSGMLILWENFVLKKKALPKNIKSYLYIICKNEWLADKKYAQRMISTEMNDSLINSKQSELTQERNDEDELIRVLLRKVMEEAPEKCKQIIERTIYNQEKLKEIWQELNYNSYQAIVQAKYNCKKNIANRLFILLRKTKKNKIDER